MPEKSIKTTRKINNDKKEDGDKLWVEVTQDVTPLNKSVTKTRAADSPKGQNTGPLVKNAPKSRAKHAPPAAKMPTASQSSYQLSAHQKKAFEQGKLEIEGKIDLHGMTQNEAHDKLFRFLKSQYKKQSRCLLVITGKGSRSSPDAPSGVLRKNIALWLEDPEIKHLILSITPAIPAHGGSGAYYILLRRQRSHHS